jgi:hypothetical protein
MKIKLKYFHGFNGTSCISDITFAEYEYERVNIAAEDETSKKISFVVWRFLPVELIDFRFGERATVNRRQFEEQ